MSEYLATDHLHNVSAATMQIMRQAQGVQDITGTNIADYEEISPDASASVTISNARTGVPFAALVNNLPIVQDGSGAPSLDNVRVLIPYTKSILRNGDDPPIEVDLPTAFYGGNIDYVARKIKSEIIRVRVPYDGDWIETTTPGVYYIPENGIPAYNKTVGARFLTGENCTTKFGSSNNATGGDVVLGTGEPVGRIYYMPLESAEITTVAELKAWLEENPIYIYYKTVEPSVTDTLLTIPYVLDANYTVSADYGTLSLSYAGIAPDEP